MKWRNESAWEELNSKKTKNEEKHEKDPKESSSENYS